MNNKRIKSRERRTNTKQFSTKKFNNTRSKKSITDSKLWNIWLMFCAFILVLSAIKLGLVITICVFIIMLIISSITYLIVNIKGNTKKKKIINIALIIILSMFIIGLLLFGAFLIYITVSSASKFDPKNLNTKELSIIYDKDGNEIARLGAEKREKVTYDELPQVLVDAIVSTEDSRFFVHNGFDAPRFMKATIGQLLGRSSAGGASTLSMQVVKNSFTSTESSGIKGIIRKFTDIYLAVFKLEKKYTKEEIIEFYVNNHSLGGVIYGVEEASKAYFNKNVEDLNLSEAAIIAGMFKAPNYYKPTANPENAAARRKTVLYLMRKHGYITKEQEEEANAIPVESLVGDATGGSNKSGSEYQDYIDTVVEEMQDKYDINPYTTSVLIYTNMDKDKQNAVNNVMNGNTYNWKDEKVQGGVSVLDSNTGKVLAIGAGRNRNVGDYNYATQGTRQPGSTAKPLFDYGPGIEYNNWSTYQLFVDEPYTYSTGQTMNNWDGNYMGTMTLRRALALSRNVPALKAFQQVDNKKIIEFVENLGITPEVENGKIHEAHAIGAFTGVNTLQMAAAYAAFSNGGYYNEPYTVEKYVLRDTKETVKHKSNKKQVMSEATAYMIASVLGDVTITGGDISNVSMKTGTTNFSEEIKASRGLPDDAIRDSWVIGFTPKTVIGMWYGYNTSDSQYCLRNLSGTIQRDYFFQALAKTVFESNREEFKMPDSVVKLGIIAGSNPPQIAPEGYTGNVVYELFKKDYQPGESNTEGNGSVLATPSVKGTYSNGKVTLTWNNVTGVNNDNYGKLVYNVYLGNTLLKTVDGTSYTYDASNKSGTLTFKVVATYESYNALASEAGSVSVKIEEETSNKEISYKVSYVCEEGLVSIPVNGSTNPITLKKIITGNSSSIAITPGDLTVRPTDSDIDAKGCSNTFTDASWTVTDGGTITVKYSAK